MYVYLCQISRMPKHCMFVCLHVLLHLHGTLYVYTSDCCYRLIVILNTVLYFIYITHSIQMCKCKIHCAPLFIPKFSVCSLSGAVLGVTVLVLSFFTEVLLQAGSSLLVKYKVSRAELVCDGCGVWQSH